MTPSKVAGKDRTLVGADGCKAGWIAVSCLADTQRPIRPQRAIHGDFRSLVSAFPAGSIIAVDMPMGLPESVRGSGRGPEQAVRPLLGQRQSSVFSIPARSAVYATDFAEACRMALATSDPPRKVSRQAFNLFAKIRQIDEFLRERGEEGIYESHPELAFWRLNGCRPVATPKKIKSRVNPAGLEDRRHLLAACGLDSKFLSARPPKGAAADDLLDACACLMTAGRIAAGTAEPFPPAELRDDYGLRMAIWA